MLGGGCVDVISHIDEFDAGPAAPPSDARAEAEVSGGACFSGQRWTGGTTPNGAHYPGRQCMGAGCHSSTSKTPMTMGGTVYPLGGEHDENDCNGLDGAGVAVVPFDDMGTEFAGRIQVNGVGNFFTNKPLPNSFKVKVIRSGDDAIQMSAVTNGDCNYCHSAVDYMNAKGRIVPKR